MIYVKRASTDPVLQGDVYAKVPFVNFSITDLFESPGRGAIRWSDVAGEPDGVAAIVKVRPSTAMVISQDCDVARSGLATLALVDEFPKVHKDLGNATSPDTLMKHITKMSRVNLKWFYLPIDASIGFTKKQAADFRVLTQVSVAELMSGGIPRVCGLNLTAREHLRHRIAYFFQRYPVDEWYALDEAELQEYEKKNPGTERFEWQKKK